jgi:site-specific DNA-methyltransferase (cytosine-N4-specific)
MTTPHYQDEWLTLHAGDARSVLSEMPAESVHTVVTSPPYWGLRDYGTATWDGGDAECDHEPDKRGSRFATPVSEKQRSNTGSGSISQRDCKCGATRIDSQLGLERTPEEYVANMVAVFREVRRVLKPSGTCWLNLGDSYVSSNSAQVPDTMRGASGKHGEHLTGTAVRPPMIQGLASKNLVGIPWRVAFALQADGWYLRSDIIWSKPNPMPESVTDRPTKSHEYLFLLTKSARYYYDAEAVAETATHAGRVVEYDGTQKNSNAGDHINNRRTLIGAGRDRSITVGATRNLRSVWTVATRPYPGAHFAVFPPELPERCIKAGSPPDGTVLDPFGGSGTTAMVAQKLGRRAVLIDLNPDYIKQQLRRNAQTPLGLEVA